MAITTSAGDGVRVTSSAKNNGTLQQAAGLPANQFVLPDSIVATNNGNVTLTTIAGRLIVIRRDEEIEETRYILSEDGGTTGTVNEDFEFPPTGGMSYAIPYVVEDAAALTGFSLISKRNRDYSLSRLFSVGNTTTGTFSWFALLDGASMESHNNIGATDRAFQIEGDGRWDFGYQQGGLPVPGGYLIVTANTDGEYGFEVVAGGQIRANRLFMTSVENTRFELDDAARVRIDGFQIYKTLYNSLWAGDGLMQDLVLQGVGVSTDYVHIDESFDVDSVLLINSYGIYTDGLTTGTVLNYASVGNIYDIQIVPDGTLVRMLNPIWDGDDPIFNWTAATGTVQERFEYVNRIRNPDADPLQNARLYLYDDFDQDFQVQLSSDVTGSIDSSILKREWQSGTAGSLPTQVRGTFVQRILRFGQSPSESALVVDARIDQAVTLVDDGGVTISEAAADLVSGTVYEHGTGTAPSNLIAYDAGILAFNAGDIVVGANSGATGTVRDITGDTAAGTLFLVDRNAIAFQDGEDLDVSAGTKAEANLTSGTGGLDLDYHWEVRASNDNLANLYGWQASKSAKASPLPWVISMLRHRSQLFFRSGGDYWSENVDGEGVFLSERGAGNILYMTSDGGWEWTPPQQYTLTLTGLITGSGGSEVRIYQRVGSNDTGDELAGVETAGTTFQYSYEHGGTDIPTIIVVFHTDYLPVWQHYDLTAANASLPINQLGDRVYSNP